MTQFRTVGLIGRVGSAEVVESLKILKQYLLSRDLVVVLDESTSEALPGHNLEVIDHEELGDICDLVVVVGGDGSLLGAARNLAKHNVPLLGVNRGRLGFLTDISPTDIKLGVGDVLDGKYLIESRFLLDASVMRSGATIGAGSGLNEIVLHPGQSGRMIEFELYIEGQFVYSQRSDGLIVATPTGSTAYSLSGGGPIMHPKLDAVVLVPMFPQSISSRPIVIDGNSELKLVISRNNQTYPMVSCDGQIHISTAPGDTVFIHKKPHRLTLIHPLQHNFYQICREKLGWGSQLGEKDEE